VFNDAYFPYLNFFIKGLQGEGLFRFIKLMVVAIVFSMVVDTEGYYGYFY